MYIVTCVIYTEPHNETSFYITRHNSLLTSHVTPGSYIVANKVSPPVSPSIQALPRKGRTASNFTKGQKETVGGEVDEPRSYLGDSVISRRSTN